MTSEAPSPAYLHDHAALAGLTETMTDHERMAFRELDPDRVLCDATVPAYWNDEVRHGCGHEATAEGLWIDGKWHPRCQQHVDGYPANRVRPLGGTQ